MSPAETEKSTGIKVFFLLINTSSGYLTGIGWSICQSPRKCIIIIIININIMWTGSGFCWYKRNVRQLIVNRIQYNTNDVTI